MNSINLEPKLEELERLNNFIKIENSIENLDIDLIVEEIFVNIVRYSNCNCIRVILELVWDVLTLEFIDDGIKFNPIQDYTADVATDIEEVKIGGLGLHLVKNMADKLSYEYIYIIS